VIVWSGWGILVPLYVVVVFFVTALGMAPLPLPENVKISLGFALTGLLAAAALYFTVKKLESREGREYIDAKTGQHFMVRPSAGSFFFVPSRYWVYVVAALGVLAGAASFFG
jgi:hypothetical protein